MEEGNCRIFAVLIYTFNLILAGGAAFFYNENIKTCAKLVRIDLMSKRPEVKLW